MSASNWIVLALSAFSLTCSTYTVITARRVARQARERATAAFTTVPSCPICGKPTHLCGGHR